MTIRLNGDPYELPAPLSIADLLARLQIDPRRVAVELNFEVIKRAHYESATIRDGDQVE